MSDVHGMLIIAFASVIALLESRYDGSASGNWLTRVYAIRRPSYAWTLQ